MAAQSEEGNPGTFYVYIAGIYKNLFVDRSLSIGYLNKPEPFAITGDSHGNRLVWAFSRLAQTMSGVRAWDREAFIKRYFPHSF